jgi:hypothetical protein
MIDACYSNKNAMLIQFPQAPGSATPKNVNRPDFGRDRV